MKPRVLLDCDGVLSDFTSAMLRIVTFITGREYTSEQVTQFDFAAALGLTKEEASRVKRAIGDTPGFAAKLRAYDGAYDGVEALHAVAEVYVVTSPWNSNPTWTHDRERWLERHFGIPHSHVVHTSAKHLVVGDMLVDDKTETLHKWQIERNLAGHAVQWQTPHNRNDTWHGLSTCSWDELRYWVQQGVR